MKVLKEKSKRELRGIKIKSFNLLAIILACAVYIALIGETISIAEKYEDLQNVSDEYIVLEEDAALVREGSDYLTEQVRMYVVTHSPEYMELFFKEVNETRRRDRALEDLVQHQVDQSVKTALQNALEQSNNLMQCEIYAMKLVAVATAAQTAQLPEEVRAVQLKPEDLALTAAECLSKAQRLVFDSQYQQAKSQIMSSVSESLSGMLEHAQGRRLRTGSELSQLLLLQRVFISILFVMSVIMFAFITVLIVKPLSIYLKCIKDDKLFEIVGAYEFKYLALTYNDIYELNAANEAILKKQATTDPLTGLFNRGGFNQMVELMQISHSPVALLIVDVDEFKSVNDGYGHAVGDRVLQKIARLLAHNFRSSDTPARIGGDEFAVILRNATYEQRESIRRKIESINAALSAPDDGLPPVSISVGGAFSVSGYNAELFQQADSALYNVKDGGRNNCAFYHAPEEQKEILENESD